MYRAEVVRCYDGIDFAERVNKLFDEGWGYVEYLEIDNPEYGYTPVMILKKED